MSGAAFDLSNPLLNIVARTAIIYLALLVGLRLTGKRQVGQLTPFDLLLLLLLSNAVQNAMVGPDTSVTGGLIAAATLFAANGIIAAIVRRSRGAAKLVEGMPTLLIRHGEILKPNLDREGISEADLLRALREHGIEDVKAVRAAILEIDGTISAVREDEFPKVEKPYHRIRGVKRTT